MRIILTRTICVIAFLFSAVSGFAQSAYVSAAVGMDVSRFSRTESGGFSGLQPGGEAMALSLRLGTRIRRNWGVELGFTRPSEVDKESTFGFPIALPRLVLGLDALPASMAPLPLFETTTRLERRDTTLDTVAWVAQPIGDRVDLVYLGGVAFNRTVEEVRFEVPRRLLPVITIPGSVRTTTYGLAPLVGLDARIALTDHVRLVPGLRLQGIGGGTSGTSGWLIRPSAGLMWEF
jgi:hypothetical protein